MTTNPGAYLCIRPRKSGLAFLSYFMVLPPKEPCGYALRRETRRNINTIPREVVPVPVLEPVPAVQVRRTGVRTVPEVTTLRRESL